mmetsp:Transcript_26905/g.84380  ORF Transcript_26905/g.84380 Transcript_26905/m.84380 type:complete len:231 (+) Transcript_26905:1339-2031(+)
MPPRRSCQRAPWPRCLLLHLLLHLLVLHPNGDAPRAVAAGADVLAVALAAAAVLEVALAVHEHAPGAAAHRAPDLALAVALLALAPRHVIHGLRAEARYLPLQLQRRLVHQQAVRLPLLPSFYPVLQGLHRLQADALPRSQALLPLPLVVVRHLPWHPPRRHSQPQGGGGASGPRHGIAPQKALRRHRQQRRQQQRERGHAIRHDAHVVNRGWPASRAVTLTLTLTLTPT